MKKVPIQHAVVNGLLQMMQLDRLAGVKIRNGAGHAKNLVVSAGGYAQLLNAVA